MKASDMEKVLEVIIAFNREKNYFSLLNVILDKMMELTNADGGTLYVREGDKLHFRIIRNNSLNIFQGGEDEISLPPIKLDKENIVNISAYAAINNEVVCVDNVYEDERFNFTGPKAYDKKTGYHTCSMLVFPLASTDENSDEVIGVIQLLNSIDPQTGQARSFEDVFDPAVLLALSNVSANALANILYIRHLTETLTERERIRSELAIAHSIQSSVLPTEFPAFPMHDEFDIYAVMKPAKDVGGDLYDFFMVDKDHLALVIGDVSGKGVPASLFMMVARTLIKNEAKYSLSTEEIFERVNRQLCEDNDSYLFVTAFIGFYNITNGVLSYTNAGHCLPIVKRAGTLECLEDACSMVLAAFEMSEYTTAYACLDPGDCLLLYSDGITEAFNVNDEQFSDERLMRLVEQTTAETARMLVETVVDATEAFAGEAEQHDDMTVLALKRLK